MATDDGTQYQKLTDAWAEWVIRKLSANGETALSDEDIAAIITNTRSVTRAVLNTLITAAGNGTLKLATDYSDEHIASALSTVNSSIASGDISAVASAKAYADVKSNAALAAAKQYTDENSSPGSVTKSYVDAADSSIRTDFASADAATLASAQSYAASAASTAKADAIADTTSKLLAYVSRETVDGLLGDLRTAVLASAAELDADVLTAANEYTDTHGGSGGGASEDYVDEQVGNARSDLTTAIATAHDDAVQTANTYTNNAIDTAADGTAELVDGKVAGLTDYVDTQDAYILQQAKQYTDESGSGGATGGVTQGYVDNADATTLASARSYADTKSGDALAGAKTYADQYKKPTAGWVKTDLASAVQTSLGKADTAVQPAALTPGAWTSWNPDSAQFTSTLQYRLTSTSVQWKGQLSRKAGVWPANTANTIGTLPSEAWPLDYTRLAGWMYGSVFYGFQISTAGVVTYQTGGTAGADTYWNGIAYAR